MDLIRPPMCRANIRYGGGGAVRAPGVEACPGDVTLMLGVARVYDALNDMAQAEVCHRKVCFYGVSPTLGRCPLLNRISVFTISWHWERGWTNQGCLHKALSSSKQL